jgi:predicted site-specific integrase-resolvase
MSNKLKTKDVMQMFGISEITVRRWCKAGMPYEAVAPRLHRYNAFAVTKWVKQNKPWHLRKDD